MRSGLRDVVIALAGAGAMAFVFYAALPLSGQTPAARVPRLASGKPDLNGVWQAINTANWDLETHAAKAALAMRPGPVVPVPAKEVVALGAVGSVPPGMGVVDGGEIPYTPAGLAKKKENQENWLQRDPEIKCYQAGVPRATYMPFPFQIFQSDKAVAIAYEYAGGFRNIYLKDPGPAQVDSWMGQSVGRWENDTFVVDVSGFNDSSWLDRAGNHHSENLKVTERYTMTDADHIQYEATLTDPAVYARPWKISMPLYRHVEKNARIGVFKCVEFVEELMYGQYRKEPVK